MDFLENKKLHNNSNNKYINVNLLLNLAKSRELPMIKNLNINRYFSKITTQVLDGIKGKIEQNVRSSTPKYRKRTFRDKNKSEINKVVLCNNPQCNIFKEGEFIIVNQKGYNINNFKQNIYVQPTYADLLIDENLS